LNLPSFLPPFLNLDGDWCEVLDNLYKVFRRDFIERPLFYRACRVFCDSRKVDSDKEEAFWHLITKEQGGERLVDYGRAKRLPWIRPIIENSDRPEIKEWEYLEKGKKVRVYLWVEDHDYVVVLERKGNRCFLVTAYYVEGESTRRRLRRKYEKRL